MFNRDYSRLFHRSLNNADAENERGVCAWGDGNTSCSHSSTSKCQDTGGDNEVRTQVQEEWAFLIIK